MKLFCCNGIIATATTVSDNAFCPSLLKRMVTDIDDIQYNRNNIRFHLSAATFLNHLFINHKSKAIPVFFGIYDKACYENEISYDNNCNKSKAQRYNLDPWASHMSAKVRKCFV